MSGMAYSCIEEWEKSKGIYRNEGGKIMKKEKENDVVYAIHATRWGSDENHSYILAIFKEREKAIELAEKHEQERGGKYGCAVIAFRLGISEVFEEEPELIRKVYGRGL